MLKEAVLLGEGRLPRLARKDLQHPLISLVDPSATGQTAQTDSVAVAELPELTAVPRAGPSPQHEDLSDSGKLFKDPVARVHTLLRQDYRRQAEFRRQTSEKREEAGREEVGREEETSSTPRQSESPRFCES